MNVVEQSTGGTGTHVPVAQVHVPSHRFGSSHHAQSMLVVQLSFFAGALAQSQSAPHAVLASSAQAKDQTTVQHSGSLPQTQAASVASSVPALGEGLHGL